MKRTKFKEPPISKTDLIVLNQKEQEMIEFATKHLHSDDLHGIGHVKRVLQIAMEINEQEQGSVAFLKCLVWFHDIGRIIEHERNEHHAKLSVELAAPLLRSWALSEEGVELITREILAHSFSFGKAPTTLEGTILRDADQLDAMGAVGVFRTCAYQALREQGLKEVLAHLDEKLLNLKSRLVTKSAQKLGKVRHDFSVAFKSQLLTELGEIAEKSRDMKR